jgi:hypothetical protein
MGQTFFPNGEISSNLAHWRVSNFRLVPSVSRRNEETQMLPI